MTFPLEKILEVSFETYLESVGRKVSSYTLAGVHADYEGSEYMIQQFSYRVPPNTEVVVGYHSTIYDGTYN